MRFYSKSHRDVMGLPLKTFWMLDRNISRVQAEEDRRQLRLLLAAQSSDSDVITGLFNNLEAEIGQPLHHAAEMEVGAIDRLKSLGSFR